MPLQSILRIINLSHVGDEPPVFNHCELSGISMIVGVTGLLAFSPRTVGSTGEQWPVSYLHPLTHPPSLPSSPYQGFVSHSPTSPHNPSLPFTCSSTVGSMIYSTLLRSIQPTLINVQHTRSQNRRWRHPASGAPEFGCHPNIYLRCYWSV